MIKVLKMFGLTSLIVAVCCALFPAAVSAKSYTFTYSNFFPPSHIQSILAEAWCKEVEKRTDGQVKIAYYPGGTLTKAAQCYDGVVTQRSDIGLSLLAYSRGRFPLMDVINLPFGNPDGQFATAVFNEINDKFSPKELSDTHVLYLHAHGPGLLHTKDKVVHKLEDLKGMKIRGAGIVADTIKALGASPVTMPMPELYQALQKGVVEGAFYPVEVNKGWKMGEVVDYGIGNYQIAYGLGFFVVMNKDKWNKLPTDIQETITQINHEWAIKHGKAWDTSDYNGMRFGLTMGNSFIGIPEDEAKRWKEAVEPVYQTYIDKCAEKGLPGQDVFDYLMESLAAYKKGKFESQYLGR